MQNSVDDRKTRKMMVIAAVFVIVLLGAVILSFVMVQRRHEKTLSAASDTEGQTEVAIEIGESAAGEAQSEDAAGTDGGQVYLVKGNDTGSNPYEKADRLAYTDTVRYTVEELSWLDAYGLCITRNEIYARHGRMFSDQDIQDYFNHQDWYVAQTSSAVFDEDTLNEVEQYNVELIRSYELRQGY